MEVQVMDKSDKSHKQLNTCVHNVMDNIYDF